MNNIFNIGAINPKENICGLDSLSLNNEDYLQLALEQVLHSRYNINKETKNLYHSIIESKDNYTVINKSFIDFFNKIIEIIDRFIKFIKSLFDRFIANLSSAFNSDSFIIKNKDKFTKFDTMHEFTTEMFNYTINPDIPVTHAIAEYKDNFYDIIDENSLKMAYTRLNNTILDNFYDKFRAIVIGLEGDYISAADYSEAIYRIYRHGDISKRVSIINKDNIYESIDNFVNFNNLKKDILRTRDNIIKEYENIKKFISSSVSVQTINNIVYVKIQNSIDDLKEFSINDGSTKYINLFIKTKTAQLDHMCNIHTLAFAGKLDAIKERYLQDRVILYNALKKMDKHGISESGYDKIPKIDVKDECKRLYDKFVKYVEDKEGIKVLDYKFETAVQRGYRQILDIPVGKYKDGRAAWRTVKELNDISSNVKLEPKKKGDNWILRIVLTDPNVYIYELSGEILIGGDSNGI